MSAQPDFSIITTCYFEEQSIDEFYTRLRKTARSLGRSYEMVMVNDGSTDGTFARLKHFFDTDPNVTTVLDLYRNAGQVNAMTAGLTHARGKALVFIDSDLQLDPEDLPSLVEEFDKGYDIVTGYRKDRRDPLLRRIPSWLANIVMRRVARHSLRDFGCTFKIYDAELVRAFELGPFKPWVTAYIFSRAQSCKELPVAHHARKYGESGWTLRKLVSFYMDHMVGLSERPFQWMSALCLAFAFLFFLRIGFAWAVPINVLPEVTSGMILNAIAFGLLVTLAVLSAVGEYVMRSFLMAQKYPAYVIREIHEKPLETGPLQ
ncbi:MAG: glycosyltransferase family 2 protein [Deltaproteobacteria bacterium]|nr:glycosyltransferase family 2 protein [Deltaproteobacteria bacterium]